MSRVKKPKSVPSSRTSLGNPAAYDASAKGGITTATKHKRMLAQFKSKGGTVLWLKRGSEYMRELGARGGRAKAANAKIGTSETGNQQSKGK